MCLLSELRIRLWTSFCLQLLYIVCILRVCVCWTFNEVIVIVIVPWACSPSRTAQCRLGQCRHTARCRTLPHPGWAACTNLRPPHPWQARTRRKTGRPWSHCVTYGPSPRPRATAVCCGLQYWSRLQRTRPHKQCDIRISRGIAIATDVKLYPVYTIEQTFSKYEACIKHSKHLADIGQISSKHRAGSSS